MPRVLHHQHQLTKFSTHSSAVRVSLGSRRSAFDVRREQQGKPGAAVEMRDLPE